MIEQKPDQDQSAGNTQHPGSKIFDKASSCRWLKHLLRHFARLRRAEQILLVYFAYTAVMGLTFGSHGLPPAGLVAINATIWIAFLAGLSRAKRADPWRDFLPYPFALLCYREAGWLSTALHLTGLEQKWIVWDRMLLSTWHLRSFIEILGPAIPILLETAYVSVYIFGPLAVSALYLYHRSEAADRLWVAFLLGLMLSYVQFPFWPSEPPRIVFPGLDLPSFASPLRRLNLFLVGSYGIHSSVFPSAHVSGAIAGALMLRRILYGRRWIGNAFLVLAILIAIAAVYGRYHYAIDALAGTAVGIVAYRLACRLASPVEQRLESSGC